MIVCWIVPAMLVVATRRQESWPSETQPAAKHRGVLLGSCLLFLSVSAAAVTFPFMQTRRDALGCDALCQGGQTSLRSGLE